MITKIEGCPYPLESDECSKYLNRTYEDSKNETIQLTENLYEDLCYYISIINFVLEG